jgi:hypothetical protein
MIDHEALKAAHPQFRLGHSQGLQDGREDARRDALAEAADEADRMVDAGLGGLCGTAIRALGDEPATEAAGDAGVAALDLHARLKRVEEIRAALRLLLKADDAGMSS